MDYLSNLENQSIYIMREAFNKFENMAMLWSIGKDSTVLLWLARKAFFGHVPFPLVHVDTTYEFPEMLEFRSWAQEHYGLDLIVCAGCLRRLNPDLFASLQGQSRPTPLAYCEPQRRRVQHGTLA